MTLYTLYDEIIIPRPLVETFSFFNEPMNLAKITPPSMGFNVLTPPPITMSNGLCIDYVVRIMGIPFRWRSNIQEYDPPNGFVDTQIKGPYSFWHHHHLFEAVDDTHTRVIDRVTYQLPFGLFGQLAHWLFVRRQLKGIFDYRRKVISALFSRAAL